MQFKGRIEKKLTKDIRGTRYRIEGPSKAGRTIHIICRFKETVKINLEMIVHRMNGHQL